MEEGGGGGGRYVSVKRFRRGIHRRDIVRDIFLGERWLYCLETFLY